MSEAVVINHIRALIDHHYDLRVSCSGCRHNKVLDLHALGERLGYDHSTMHDDLTPKLKCSKCGNKGRKKLGLTLSSNRPGIHGR
jgi:ribosomal protein S27E